MKKRNVFMTALLLLLLAAIVLSGCSGGKQEEIVTEPEPDTVEQPSEAVSTPIVEPPNSQQTEEEVKETKKEEVAVAEIPESKIPEPSVEPETPPAEAKAEDKKVEEKEEGSSYKGALGSPIAEPPVFLTSAGQSADVQMVKVLLDRGKIEYIINPVGNPEDIKDVKTLILAVGGSSKGLGAAGIDADEELKRVNSIISKAKELKLKIISMHIGGEARRGELSDKFISACVPASNYVIVVEEGNKDNLFTKLTDAGGIPMDTVKKITEASEPLKSAFK